MKTAPGLTLIEMLVTIAAVALVMTAIADSVLFFYRANTSSIEQSYQISSARRGVELLVRDIREAAYGDDGAYPVSSIGSTTLEFYSDTDRDASVERIRYSLVGDSFTRNVLDSSGNPPSYTGLGATSTAAFYVRNAEQGVAVFRYYGEDGAEITDYADVGDVRSVTVRLVVNVQPIRAPGEFTLQSSATLRNLRSQ